MEWVCRCLCATDTSSVLFAEGLLCCASALLAVPARNTWRTVNKTKAIPFFFCADLGAARAQTARLYLHPLGCQRGASTRRLPNRTRSRSRWLGWPLVFFHVQDDALVVTRVHETLREAAIQHLPGTSRSVPTAEQSNCCQIRNQPPQCDCEHVGNTS